MTRCQEPRVRSQESATASRLRAAFVVVVVLLLIPIVAHGCHKDDADHEPSAARHESETPP